MNQELFSFIASCPTAFQAVAHSAQMLESAGYTHLSESEAWTLEAGRGYFVTRNGSSIIAFRVPKGGVHGFMITAAHCDSPCFKIKENAELGDDHFVRLSTEGYGGMIYSTWLDRPLSVAGRVLVKTPNGVETRLVDFREPMAIMPNVAIHMNRSVNKDTNYNPAVDLVPLYGGKGSAGSFRARVAALAGAAVEDLVTTDLYLYNPQQGVEWDEFISAPRLDDLQCAFSSLTAFLAADEGRSAKVCCIFDNEEVGSRTKQGAAGTFLYDVLHRVCESFGLADEDYHRAVANSFMLSCDNAHALHPNHPEYVDKNHTVVMNGGIVIKYNAAQHYTSDAVSAALFEMICREAGVPIQRYANRADIAGGGTLGNIANAQVSLNTVDIGLAQLAMHSSFETAGAKDTESMVKALRRFFEKSVTMERDGAYTIG
ncbi:MAG: M18 family aminopeptidase [Oscillospiraceae bacterium]|nr:M18 family aminopeptidase [Oscillospiraceae bacterium]